MFICMADFLGTDVSNIHTVWEVLLASGDKNTEALAATSCIILKDTMTSNTNHSSGKGSS